MTYELVYKRYSENAILIEWPSKIDENILQDLIFFKNMIEIERVKDIVEVIITYNSILVFYKLTIKNIYDEFMALKSLYLKKSTSKKTKKRLWKIPVCYSPALAPDLEAFSKSKSLKIQEVVSLHSTPTYQVYFLGFLPGFMYLGGLDPKLNFQRKKTPKLRVEKGSVAIGGNQTGIYPMDSPGGWHVIGRCPLNFFFSMVDPPCNILPNDRIQFISIKEKEYNDISLLVKTNNYTLNPILL